MEKRKITVISNKTQMPQVFESDAVNVAELKKDMAAKGIDYENMDLLEGISGTCLLNNDTILPQNVEYKGQPTNDLIIMLSTTNKRISSGRLSEYRKDVLERAKNFIIKNPETKEKFGNITQMSSQNILLLMAELGERKPKKNVTISKQKKEVLNSDIVSVSAFDIIVEKLYKAGILSTSDVNDIKRHNSLMTSPFSKEELQKIKEKLSN